MHLDAPDGLAPEDILQELSGLLSGEGDPIASLANAAALLAMHLQGVNWVGFYILRGEDLVLGPFQGRPACTRIPSGRGVCGAALARREPVVVEDVALFPDHIACDPASRSEIAVPVLAGARALGVLDCDAPTKGRFGDAERGLFEAAADMVGRHLAEHGARL